MHVDVADINPWLVTIWVVSQGQLAGPWGHRWQSLGSNCLQLGESNRAVARREDRYGKGSIGKWSTNAHRTYCNVRPWWRNISHFSTGFNTCFIHVSNRLAGMDGTLGVAPRMRTTQNLLHGSFHNNLRQQPFADFVGVRGKEGLFRARKHRLRANVRFCAYKWWLIHIHTHRYLYIYIHAVYNLKTTIMIETAIIVITNNNNNYFYINI